MIETSKEAVAAAAELWHDVCIVCGETEEHIAAIIDKHIAPLKAENDRLDDDRIFLAKIWAAYAAIARKHGITPTSTELLAARGDDLKTPQIYIRAIDIALNERKS